MDYFLNLNELDYIVGGVGGARQPAETTEFKKSMLRQRKYGTYLPPAPIAKIDINPDDPYLNYLDQLTGYIESINTHEFLTSNPIDICHLYSDLKHDAKIQFISAMLSDPHNYIEQIDKDAKSRIFISYMDAIISAKGGAEDENAFIHKAFDNPQLNSSGNYVDKALRTILKWFPETDMTSIIISACSMDNDKGQFKSFFEHISEDRLQEINFNSLFKAINSHKTSLTMDDRQLIYRASFGLVDDSIARDFIHI